MRNSTKFFFVSIGFAVLFLLSQVKVNAQCNLVTRDVNGNLNTEVVSCSDIPLYIPTGNPPADLQAKQGWDAQVRAMFPNWGSSTGSYFEMHQSDYDALPAATQAAIRANVFIHIIP